jgi:hypothetical protein
LILVGFGLVALPLLVAVIWALFNLDRLAEQSEQIINMGVASRPTNTTYCAMTKAAQSCCRICAASSSG